MIVVCRTRIQRAPVCRFNGWIKEKLLVDFRLADAIGFEEAAGIIERCVGWYNSKRPCWSLGYMTPDACFAAFMAGDVERKDTFENRVLDPTPKFVRERLAAAEEAARSNGGIGSSDPVLFGVRVHDAA